MRRISCLFGLLAISGCYPHHWHHDPDCLLDACLVGTCLYASAPPPPAVVVEPAPPPAPVPYVHRHGPGCGCQTRMWHGEPIYWINGHWEWQDGQPVR